LAANVSSHDIRNFQPKTSNGCRTSRRRSASGAARGFDPRSRSSAPPRAAVRAAAPRRSEGIDDAPRLRNSQGWSAADDVEASGSSLTIVRSRSRIGSGFTAAVHDARTRISEPASRTHPARCRASGRGSLQSRWNPAPARKTRRSRMSGRPTAGAGSRRKRTRTPARIIKADGTATASRTRVPLDPVRIAAIAKARVRAPA
jgi:hypothetical protein